MVNVASSQKRRPNVQGKAENLYRDHILTPLSSPVEDPPLTNFVTPHTLFICRGYVHEAIGNRLHEPTPASANNTNANHTSSTVLAPNPRAVVIQLTKERVYLMNEISTAFVTVMEIAAIQHVYVLPSTRPRLTQNQKNHQAEEDRLNAATAETEEDGGNASIQKENLVLLSRGTGSQVGYDLLLTIPSGAVEFANAVLFVYKVWASKVIKNGFSAVYSQRLNREYRGGRRDFDRDEVPDLKKECVQSVESLFKVMHLNTVAPNYMKKDRGRVGFTSSPAVHSIIPSTLLALKGNNVPWKENAGGGTSVTWGKAEREQNLYDDVPRAASLLYATELLQLGPMGKNPCQQVTSQYAKVPCAFTLTDIDPNQWSWDDPIQLEKKKGDSWECTVVQTLPRTFTNVKPYGVVVEEVGEKGKPEEVPVPLTTKNILRDGKPTACFVEAPQPPNMHNPENKQGGPLVHPPKIHDTPTTATTTTTSTGNTINNKLVPPGTSQQSSRDTKRVGATEGQRMRASKEQIEALTRIVVRICLEESKRAERSELRRKQRERAKSHVK